MSRFTNDVLRERAVLAIEDPAGEAEAVVPMTRDQAFTVLFGPKRPPIADPFGSWRRSLERMGYELDDDLAKAAPWRRDDGRQARHRV